MLDEAAQRDGMEAGVAVEEAHDRGAPAGTPRFRPADTPRFAPERISRTRGSDGTAAAGSEPLSTTITLGLHIL